MESAKCQIFPDLLTIFNSILKEHQDRIIWDDNFNEDSVAPKLMNVDSHNYLSAPPWIETLSISD